MFHSLTPSNFGNGCLGAQLEMRWQRTEVSKINQQKRLTPIGPQTEAAAMSHLELAAILRAKAWRNYPGVFAAPKTRECVGQRQSKQDWPTGEVLLTHVPTRLSGNLRLHWRSKGTAITTRHIDR